MTGPRYYNIRLGNIKVSNNLLTIKGEKTEEKEKRRRIIFSLNVVMAPFNVPAGRRRREDRGDFCERYLDGEAAEDSRGSGSREDDRGQGRLTNTPQGRCQPGTDPLRRGWIGIERLSSKDSMARLGPDPSASVAALRDLGLSDEEIARYFVTTPQEIQSLVQRASSRRSGAAFLPGRPKTDPDRTDDMNPTRPIAD
ncbi:hypothetical protein HNQ96_005698 [Aminobacter lissarensis]|uniref:Uncharacterized protein n=1 Tax=Aminobacter carboxidus TaxID=376165 RepID=A0A8E1WLC4_9HYPH|nr:hypothetical protein [Aminobacter lissarensis]